MLYSQSVEAQLRSLPLDFALDAIEIARDYDYETSSEVSELIDAVTSNARCKHGVAWRHCISECDKPCGRGHLAKS